MKTLKHQLKKHSMLYVGIVMLLLSQSVSVVKAQNGQNDASFDRTDRVSGQGANGTINVSAVQSDNKLIVAGAFSTYNGANANGLARLTMDGKLDKSFKVGEGADGYINAITIQPNERIIIAGNFTSYKGTEAKNIARLKTNGNIDNTFNAGVGSNGSISQVIVQPNGKILVSGYFTEYNGVPVRSIVRLNKNGTVDNSFEAIVTDSISLIRQIALLPDGKILVAGNEYPGLNMIYYSVIRLNSNGERDFTFNKSTRSTGDLNPDVSAIKIQDNGNILLAVKIYDGGSSVPFHGFISQLDSLGNEIGLTGLFWINSLHIQPDGKILAAGFKNADWYDFEKRVVRLNPDLSIDSSFLFNDDKPYETRRGADIGTAALQIDGKIVVAGNFYDINGLISNNIARLNPDGSYDPTFNQHTGFDGTVLATAVTNNRKLIVGGFFSRFNYQFRSNIVQLKENGELDPSFNVGTGTNGRVNAIAVQPNGKVLIGGSFTLYNGRSCNNVARLNADGSVDTNFTISADAEVRKIIIDKDGRALLAGDFENINGAPRPAIVRIKINGQVDDTFNPTIDAYGRGYDCKISSRGKIYLAVIYQDGLYTFGTDVYCLNKNGSRDLSFNFPTGEFIKINTLAFNNDNRLLAGGLIYNSEHFQNDGAALVLLNADGSVDSSFQTHELSNLLNGNIRTIQVLENDRLVIGGEFTANLYASVNHIALLNSDGSINSDFEGTAGNSVYTATPVRDDKLIIGGSFSDYVSVVRNGIARINVAAPDEARRKPDLIAAEPAAAEELQMVAYPNPATTIVTIENLTIGSTFRIFNAIGKEMHSEVITNTKATIHLADYPNGIYFIVSESKEIKSTSKFVVNK